MEGMVECVFFFGKINYFVARCCKCTPSIPSPLPTPGPLPPTPYLLQALSPNPASNPRPPPPPQHPTSAVPVPEAPASHPDPDSQFPARILETSVAAPTILSARRTTASRVEISAGARRKESSVCSQQYAFPNTKPPMAPTRCTSCASVSWGKSRKLRVTKKPTHPQNLKGDSETMVGVAEVSN